MSKEGFPSPDHREVDTEDERRWNHSELRREAKDLRIIIEQTPEDFPNRDRLLKITDEILTLVPVYNQTDEDRDERRRLQLAEDIKRVSNEYLDSKTNE